MRIGILEYDPIIRERLISLLTGEPGFQIIGTFSSAEEALVRCDFSNIDILLLEIELPGISGIELISEVKIKFPEVEFMVYSSCDDNQIVFDAIKAGASSYLVKGCRSTELIKALTELYDGGAPMTSRIERMVVLEFQKKGKGTTCVLSKREREVLKEIECGLSYKEIASKMQISQHTINSHIKNIYGKLSVQNKRDALIKARGLSII